ncbi:MAG: glycine/betaine ABC transporter [Acidobacteria bacterium]|nr:MAG: glycine/betaine ABC transporter [Acidobacteriota bacterium]
MSTSGNSKDRAKDSIFELDGVVVEVDGRKILGELSGAVRASGITAVAGPSGSGKSTFLRLLNRLEVPTRGQISYRGADLSTLDPLALRREVGMVFQRPVLFGGTVIDNLAVAAPGLSADRAIEVLARAGLGDEYVDREVDSLSGGEAQRVCIARTLAAEPSVMLLDEPTSALDAGPRLALEDLGVELAALGTPLVWITHDLGQMERIATDVIILIGGQAEYWGELGGLVSSDSKRVREFLRGGTRAS